MHTYYYTGFELWGGGLTSSLNNPLSLESYVLRRGSIKPPSTRYRLKNYVIVVDDTKISSLTVIRIDEIVKMMTVRPLRRPCSSGSSTLGQQWALPPPPFNDLPP